MNKKITRRYNKLDGSLTTEKSRRLVDPETGEEVWLKGVEKVYYGQKHFWKMYLFDFLHVLGIIESKQLDVIAYIMEKTDPLTNEFRGTFKHLAAQLNISEPTVNEAIQKLLASDFMTKTTYRSIYRINPNILVQGHEAKRQGLMVTYREEKNAQTFNAAKRMNALNPDDNQLSFELNEEGTAVLTDPAAEEKCT